MPTPLRVCTFNVENLFSRAKLLNFADNGAADGLLVDVETLRKELRKQTYDKPAILALYKKLKEYIEVVEVRGKLFDRYKKKVVAGGVDDWGGFIGFKREKFSEPARANTAKVLRTVNADVVCLVEVESRPILRHFCVQRLPRTSAFKSYAHHMLIDGNDNRGIDVALASRIPYRTIFSHIDDRDAKGEVFSRDCLEIELLHPGGFSIWMLLNHLKSKGYGQQAVSNDKRLRQATRVARLLQRLDLKKDRVIVCGDLNDTPASAPLKPLIDVPHLDDVLALTFPDAADRWTYHYRKNEQIDYLFVSKPLRDALQSAGVERRGIWDVGKYTNGATQPFNTVKSYTQSASDHGAVWAEFMV